MRDGIEGGDIVGVALDDCASMGGCRVEEEKGIIAGLAEGDPALGHAFADELTLHCVEGGRFVSEVGEQMPVAGKVTVRGGAEGAVIER